MKSHLQALHEAFLELGNHGYLARGSVGKMREDAIQRMEKNSSIHGYTNYVFYSGAMADGFNQEGNLVKEVLLTFHGDGQEICRALQEEGLHPSYTPGTRVIILSPFTEIGVCVLAAPNKELQLTCEQGVFRLGYELPGHPDFWYIREIQPSSRMYCYPNLIMVTIMAEEDYPDMRSWFPRFTLPERCEHE